MEIYGSGETLCRINWVPIYLEVYWISNLATGDIKKVERCYVEGTKIGAKRSKYIWRKEQPEMSDKVSWAEFIQYLLDEGGELIK